MSGRGWRRRPAHWVLLGFLAVAGYLVVAEHRAHLALIAAVALLAACILMNRLMHRETGAEAKGEQP